MAAPQFINISTYVASIECLHLLPEYPDGVHGATKAMANYLVRKLAIENGDVCAWVLAPGPG